jgi:CHAD domain-containing protein
MAKSDGFDWDGALSAGTNARRRLPELIRNYYEAGREVTGGAAAPEALHRFRLRTKRVRYTVELFRACYGPGLDGWLAGVREIQNHLGAVSDCATTCGLVAAIPAEDSPGRERLALYLKRREAREAAAFRRYWQRTFDKPGEARRWVAYFGRKKK